MIIRADLHVHSLASADGVSAVGELAAAARARGLDAIAVSDHNRCTSLPQEAPVLLIPAVEISTDSGHLLGLFLREPVNEAFLRVGASLAACVAEIHRCGGAAVLAHPFAPQILEEDALRALPVDAIETANARAALHPGCNEKAVRLAAAMRLPATGGSDAHSAREVANAYTELDAAERTPQALREALLSGHCRAVVERPCRWRDKGVSKLQKARHSGGKTAAIRARGYQLACMVRDILHI